MARPTYTFTGLVLKRTKLGEADAIVTFLAQDGSQLRGVAKGARKPQSSFASRLELASVCDVMAVEGKSLDIIKEARLREAFSALRSDFFKFEAAAPMLEVLEKTTQPALRIDRLFDMSVQALLHLQRAEEQTLKYCCAHLIKTLAFLGMRPQLTECLGCGVSLPLNAASPTAKQALALLDGGVICSECLLHFDTIWVEAGVLRWIDALLYATLDEVDGFDLSNEACLPLVRFLQQWIYAHANCRLKSLDFIFTSPLV